MDTTERSIPPATSALHTELTALDTTQLLPLSRLVSPCQLPNQDTVSSWALLLSSIAPQANSTQALFACELASPQSLALEVRSQTLDLTLQPHHALRDMPLLPHLECVMQLLLDTTSQVVSQSHVQQEPQRSSFSTSF